MSGDPEDFTDSAEEWEAPVHVSTEDDGKNKSAERQPPLRDQLDGEEREITGELVRVEFRLPDGKVIVRDHYMGQTVACLKAQLEDVDGVKYDKTTLYLGDRLLLDPLSLNDLPFKEGEVNHVTVRIAE